MSITVITRPSRAYGRAVDYVVQVDGVTIYTTSSRAEADYIAAAARLTR
jgi:hypothetical protein